MCTRPKETWLPLDGSKLLFREPVGADPESYVLFMKDCDRCPSCLEKRARNLAIRAMHEAQMHGQCSSFITCTYRDDALPAHGSVSKRDVVLFLKRLRHAIEPRRLRYLIVAEYGSHTFRAHYHALIFGEDFSADRKPWGKSKSGFQQFESATLTEAWGLGHCTVAELTLETCMYVCRYALKSALPSGGRRGARWWQHPVTGQWLWREREFQRMSTHPGLGRSWFEKYHADVMSGDAVVMRGGQQFKPPRYYDRIVREWSEEDYQAVKAKRLQEAQQSARFRDTMPKRLEAIEVCQQAKHRLSKRDGV